MAKSKAGEAVTVERVTGSEIVLDSPDDTAQINYIYNACDDIIKNYCQEHDIHELSIPPRVYMYLLQEIHDNIFINNKYILRDRNVRYNQYNQLKVAVIYEHVYKKLCNKYAQEVKLKGFYTMVECGYQTLYNWLNSEKIGIIEKAREDRLDSLENALADKSRNPMQTLPKLNHYYGWNLPGVSREQVRPATALEDVRGDFERFRLEDTGGGEDGTINGENG